MSGDALAKLLDHTLLAPTASRAQVFALCDEVVAHGFATACIAPRWVPEAVAYAAGGASICTVIGFPSGAHATRIKAAEAAQAVADGAAELDMVLALGPALQRDDAATRADIGAVIDAAEGRPVKVIMESAVVQGDDLRWACEIAAELGAAFVKTSTGFGPGGATLEAVALMRQTVGDRCGVKASGGIRDRAAALAMLEAGATRLGTSASLAILADTRNTAHD